MVDLNEPRMQALCENLVKFKDWADSTRWRLEESTANSFNLLIAREVIMYSREEIELCFAHLAVTKGITWST